MNRAVPPLVGVVVGQAVPLVILAPAFLWGELNEVLDQGRMIYLIPALALILVPGWFLGRLAAQASPDRQLAWRFVTGLFLGASITAAFLVGRSTADLDVISRIGATVFGGPILAGFWIWLGAILGLSSGYHKRERRAPRAQPEA